MLLTPFCLMLTFLPLLQSASLLVSPNRSQFFRYESISMSCEDQLNSTSWKLKRKTKDSGVGACSSGWGHYSSGSTCTIRNAYPPDSGEYWCESDTREQSRVVNITITGGSVILESPVLPVPEGADVVLYCRANSDTSNHMYHFFKDGNSVFSSNSGEMTIHKASRSDQGLYSCSISGSGESASSWLIVTGSPTSSAPSAASVSFPVFIIVCHVLVGTPYLITTILLALVYRDRRRASLAAANRSSKENVIMEIVV